MAVPTFVAVGSDRNATPEGTTSLTLPVPAGSAGELLIAVVAVKINPSTTTPAGWTPIVAGFNQNTCAPAAGVGIPCQLSTWWKIADGTESSISVTFGPNPRQGAGAVLRYAGAHPTNPIAHHAIANGSSATPTAPALVTTSPDNLIVRAVVADADQAKSLFTAEPATARFELASTTVFGPGSSYTTDAVVVAGSDAPQPTPGDTGTAAWSLPSSDQWAAITIAVQPAEDPGGGDGDDQPSGCLAIIIAILKWILRAILRLLGLLWKAIVAGFRSWRRRRSGN